MKKEYEKPVFEIEEYHTSSAIAATCGIKVTYGPDYFKDGSWLGACDEYNGDDDPFGISLASESAITGSWYAESDWQYQYTTCSCYHSAGNEGYFTS